MVNEYGTRLHVLKRALGANGNFAQVIVIADAGENEIGIRTRCAWSVRRFPLVPGHPFGGLFRVAVIDRHRHTGLCRKMARHRKAHYAKANPGCFECHVSAPVFASLNPPFPHTPPMFQITCATQARRIILQPNRMFEGHWT
jgi:hypothetical protein